MTRCACLALVLTLLPAQPAPADPPRPERVVLLAGGLSDEMRITFAATGHPGVLLLDSAAARPAVREFLTRFRAEQVVPVGSFTPSAAALARDLGAPVAPIVGWKSGPPVGLWKVLYPKAERVVLCHAASRRLLLHAACLAGALRAPLVVTRGGPDEDADLRRRLADWQTRAVYAVGAASPADLPGVKVTALADEPAVAAAYLREQLRHGPVTTLVVANPGDTDGGGLSALAPLVAVRKRAALVLTNEAGTNVAEVVRAALASPDLERADALLLVGDLRSLPMERRPNPVPGKDLVIETEPLAPTGTAPFSFATGRLFHADPAIVLLALARERLLAGPRSPCKALVVSNPGGGLPLLETFSRHTVRELRNAGYETTAFLGKKEAAPGELRRLLPEHDIFLWEGHYQTMVEHYGVPAWTEPLRPSLIFLQSCLALNEKEAMPMLQRGAVAVVGSSSRNYSASGGAFALAYFDALAYDDATLGGALRQAKNFLLAYAVLKEKRLGDGARMGGANLRSAWAFTLWGDPTLKLPRPTPPADALAPGRQRVKGDTIILTLPEEAYENVTSEKYQTRAWPNARLAGLLTRGEDDARNLVPLAFAEVHLPQAPAGKVPRLSGKLPDRNRVFLWDARRRCGYLLVVPRASDGKEVRLRVTWEEPER